MSNQTSSIHQIQVGTPPTKSINANKWEVIEVHYNGFEGLPSEMGVPVHSPEFMCFGHKWRLRVYPGGASISDEGRIAVSLENRTDERIAINFGFSVKNKNGRGLKAEFGNQPLFDSKLMMGVCTRHNAV